MPKKRYRVRDDMGMTGKCDRCSCLFSSDQLIVYFQYKKLCPTCLDDLEYESDLRRSEEYEIGFDLENYEDDYDE